MMTALSRLQACFLPVLILVMTGILMAVLTASPSHAQNKISAFAQAIAEAAARDDDVAAFYRANGYKPIWTGKGSDDRARRAALLKVLARAGDHGLPAYASDVLKKRMQSVKSTRELGRLEYEMSKLFVSYAQSINSGVLSPRRVDSGIVRTIPRKSGAALLAEFSQSNASRFLKALPPKSPEYARLMKEKLRLETMLSKGGWGKPVPVKSLKPGQSGDAVVLLRNRLINMGYLKRSASQTYDVNMQTALQLFQRDQGLSADGVAGPGTMAEINRQVETRLAAIIVAMERERWTNIDRGERHVWVNLTEQHVQLLAKINMTVAALSFLM